MYSDGVSTITTTKSPLIISEAVLNQLCTFFIVLTIEVVSISSFHHSGHIAGDESDISMVHNGMWKLSNDDYNRTWSYSGEKPQLNTDPNDDVRKKKEKPNMVGVLEMVRRAALFRNAFLSKFK